jgi:hypothetical protein
VVVVAESMFPRMLEMAQSEELSLRRSQLLLLLLPLRQIPHHLPLVFRVVLAATPQKTLHPPPPPPLHTLFKEVSLAEQTHIIKVLAEEVVQQLLTMQLSCLVLLPAILDWQEWAKRTTDSLKKGESRLEVAHLYQRLLT